MEKLVFIGFGYSVCLETGVLPMHFQSSDDAEKYCKAHYSNTLFQIIPVPIFAYKQEGS